MEHQTALDGFVDKYHLFYVEAIMQDSSFPQISHVKEIFEKLTIDEFIDMVDKVLAVEDYEATQQFLYFLILFRDMKHLQEYMNSPLFTLDMLEKLVLFTYGHCTAHDHSTERIIDEILYFIKNERLLDLVLSSKYIARDKLLLFFILSRFDIDMLNRYFSQIKNVNEFISYFLRMPDEMLRSIISRNYQLFQYIMLMMAEGDTDQNLTGEFLNKYRKDIDQFSRINDIIRKYRSNTDSEKDRDLPFDQRDMQRIAFLVNMIKECPDPVKAVEYFAGEKVFIDDFEKKIVLEVVTNPLLKNTFHYNGRLLISD